MKLVVMVNDMAYITDSDTECHGVIKVMQSFKGDKVQIRDIKVHNAIEI